MSLLDVTRAFDLDLRFPAWKLRTRPASLDGLPYLRRYGF
jgi:hypothetical protein